nr:hypothetical protein BaRGS_017294 [Batillaria attramentaria]
MDSLIKEAGGWGKFQIMMSSTIKFGKMPIAWSMMLMSFAGMVPDWWCLPPDDDLGHNDNQLSSHGNGHYGNWSRDNTTFQVCTIPDSGGQSCDDYVVFDETMSTVVNEWSLVCDLSNVKPLMTSLQMVGVLVGAFVGGQAADMFGRRVTVYMTSLCHVIASLIAAFSVTWQMFMVMRVMIGITLGVFLVSSFSYPLEFVNPAWRQVVSFIPAWSVGVSIFALMAWLVPNWSYLHIGFVPESARWLAAKGRLEEAEAVVERVARVNGRPKPNDTLSRLRAVAEEERQAGQGRRYTYLDVYRGWRMAFTTLVLHFIWFSSSFSYYAISFGVSALSGNVFLNIFIMANVEIPSDFSTVFLANKWDTSEDVVRGYIVVGVLMAVSGLACLLLRETKGQGLQDSMEIKAKVVEDKEVKAEKTDTAL